MRLRERGRVYGVMMTDPEHVHSLLSDYALGLLSPEAQRRVERHIAQCPDCRAAARRERALAPLVRGTVHRAARPAPGRLAVLRPAIALPHARVVAPLYRRLAPMTMVVCLLALGLLFGRGTSLFAPVAYAEGTPMLGETDLQLPTATIAAVVAPAMAAGPSETARSLQAIGFDATAAPDPRTATIAPASIMPTPAPATATANTQ